MVVVSQGSTKQSNNGLGDFSVSQWLPEALRYYLQWHYAEGHTATTIRSYESHLGLFVRWLSDQGVNEYRGVNQFHIIAYMGDLRGRVSARTVYTYITAIKAWFSWGVQFGLLEASPATNISKPRVPRSPKGFNTNEVFEALMALCPWTATEGRQAFLGARRASQLWLLRTTGMRRQELAGLRVSDLDFDTQGGRILIRLGKGQKDRVVPFHRLAKRPMLRYLSGRRGVKLPDLWLKIAGGVQGYTAIGRDLWNIAERAGVLDQIDDICHSWRRTCAYELVKSGMMRQQIVALMGWTSPKMLDAYIESAQDAEAAIESYRELSGARSLELG